MASCSTCRFRRLAAGGVQVCARYPMHVQGMQPKQGGLSLSGRPTEMEIVYGHPPAPDAGWCGEHEPNPTTED